VSGLLSATAEAEIPELACDDEAVCCFGKYGLGTDY
jgi:hypothetical protein